MFDLLAGRHCREDRVAFDDRQDEANQFRRSPTGPRVAPPRQSSDQPAAPTAGAFGGKRRMWSAVIFILLISGLGIRAYRDLSRPEARAYWKDQYFVPSMTSSLLKDADFGPGSRGRPALFISGEIGAASAAWLHARLDEVDLAPGDTVLMSSPGGDLKQAIMMGEIIRSRGLATAVGTVDVSGQIRPSACASACVLAYAGGANRYGVEGSMLGVHRFVTLTPGSDPVAATQRMTGALLRYVTRMGVSSSFVEAMTETRDVRWLDTREAAAMHLITDPVARP
jgi:hypothetical protein